jgi:hypothetical protein
MRLKFMFFFSMEPSLNSLGQNLYVYLYLLIDELKQLWLFEGFDI